MSSTHAVYQNNSDSCISADPQVLSIDDATNVRFYRHEIGQVAMLSNEQVRYLAQRIERGKKNNSAKEPRGYYRQPPKDSEEVRVAQEAQEAKHQLIEANLRLVLHLAKKYKGLGVDVMDLVQEGSLGLMHAVDKFDYTKGYRFSTYASWWIRHYITRALAEQAHNIRVPIYKVEELRRLARIRRRLQQQTEPTLEDLAGQMELTVQKVTELLSTNRETVSLDTPHKAGDDEMSLSETLEDDPRYSPERVVITETLQAQVQDLLRYLTPRERKVLQLRYGLDDRAEHSLVEAGKRMGLSHEAVRQLEFRALRKLDHPSRDRMLQEFLG